MEQPALIHEHALNNLRYIRDAMERTVAFTSIPGWGGVAIGFTATATSLFAQEFTASNRGRWLTVWLTEAVVAALIALLTMIRKGRRNGVSFLAPASKRFFVSYSAPLLAAGLLTIILVRQHAMEAVPATWLLLYGSSFISSGAFSIRVIPVMGVCFMLLGLIACFVSLPASNVLLGAGFGGLHVIFGVIIARTYGG